MPSPDLPATDPADWYLITKSAEHDPTQFRTMLAASEIASLVLATIDLHAGHVDARDEFWHRIAVGAYAQLRAHEASFATTTTTRPALPHFTATAADIRAWLAQPNHPGATDTVADRLHLDDTFHGHASNTAVVSRLALLVNAAQDAGILADNDHNIHIWYGVDVYIGLPCARLTIQPPTGPQLITGPLDLASLLGHDAIGQEAAVNAITGIAHLIDNTLAGHRTGPPTSHHPPTSAAHRAFAAPIADPTATPVPPSTGPAPTRDHPHQR